MAGGVLVSTGMITASFAHSVVHMYITIGIISGEFPSSQICHMLGLLPLLPASCAGERCHARAGAVTAGLRGTPFVGSRSLFSFFSLLFFPCSHLAWVSCSHLLSVSLPRLRERLLQAESLSRWGPPSDAAGCLGTGLGFWAFCFFLGFAFVIFLSSNLKKITFWFPQ